MKALVSGGTGFVGRFVVERLLADGHEVAVLARNPPPPQFFSAPVRFLAAALDPETDFRPLLAGVDALVHGAFDHLPDRYRGGEGGDPDGFRRRNVGGSLALFSVARAEGVARAVFLSSRAAYGRHPAGLVLREETPLLPDTLYGEAKRAVETELAAMAHEDFMAASLRITGVYGAPGAGRAGKWDGLLRDFLAGRPVASRAGSEVHGLDVAAAVKAALNALSPERPHLVLNVSDIVVDNADVLAAARLRTGTKRALPRRADSAALNIMATDRLRALGWTPGGWPLFHAAMDELMRRIRE